MSTYRRVYTGCGCCDVHLCREGRGIPLRIRYNGQEYLGWERLSAALGLSRDAVRNRVLRGGTCLQQPQKSRKERPSEIQLGWLMLRWRV